MSLLGSASRYGSWASVKVHPNTRSINDWDGYWTLRQSSNRGPTPGRYIEDYERPL